MHTSVETVPAEITSARRMVIMLVLAFVGAQLNAFGSLVALILPIALPTRNPGSSIIISQNAGLGMVITVLAFLLLSASFLALSLYPERGQRQIAAGFLGLAAWVIGVIILYSLPRDRIDSIRILFVGEAGIGIAIALSLLASGRIKAWRDLAGALLGLLIGAGLRNTNLYPQSNFDFSPIWLSTVLFLELLSRRAGWRTALIGVMIWVGLIALSVLTAKSLHYL